MGRKIKKQAVMLTVILTAIYIQQPVFRQIAEAKITENETRPYDKDAALTEKTEAEGSQGDAKNPGEEGNPGETGKPGQEGPPGEIENPEESKEPEEPEKPEEPIRKFSLEDREPNGKNGYYITTPSVKIIHNDSRGSTVYRFTNSCGEQKEERIQGESLEATIMPDLFRDGTNTLDVWLEDEDGVIPEDSKESRTYNIDTEKPAVFAQAPRGFDVWYQKETALTVKAQDGEHGSGVSYVSCYSGNKMIGCYEADNGIFLIDFASSGGKPVKASIRTEDMAGNTAVSEIEILIDNTPPNVSIEGFQDYMITSESVEAVFKVQEDNILGTQNVSILWKNVDGKEVPLPSGEWKDTEGALTMRQKLEQDGIYSMEIHAADKAGYETSRKAQVIIDKNNPVISYTDSLDGAYLREFCLNYAASEIIKDFTTYTYEIKLDGQLYTLGQKVTEEGSHHLRVQAQDAAGNIAFSTARFVIDRTPPEIRFDGVKEGERYEKEKTFRIRLSDTEDTFERIKINGKQQKLSRAGKVYEYHLQEPGEYRVEVKAKDKAENKNERSILFAVVKEKTMLEKVLSPVKKSLGMEKDLQIVSDDKKGKVSEVENKGGKVLAVGIITVLAAVMAAVFKILRK